MALLFVLLTAMLVGVEMAFAFSNRLRIELTKDENLRGKVFSFFFSHFPDFPNILQLLHLTALFLFLTFAVRAGLTYGGLGLAVCLVASFFILFFFCDIVLRVVAHIGATSFFSALTYPMFVIYWICLPFEKFFVYILSVLGLASKVENLSFSINRIVRDLDGHEVAQSKNEEEDFGNEVKMFQNALDFSKVPIKDSMVPRTEIVAVDIDTPIADLRELFVESHFSRILVYKDNVDNILGYVHSADIFDNPIGIESILNPIIVVPELMTANKLLRLFRKQKKSLALVVDEFGGTSGIITIEDVMEEIFGEIEDEHDDDNDEFVAKKLDNTHYVLSARLEVEAVNEKFGLNLPVSDEYITIGGLVLNTYGFLPNPKEEILVDKRFLFRMTRVTATRIDLMQLTILPDSSATTQS